MRHFLFFLLTCIASVALQAETRTRFNADWRFILQDDSTFRAPEIPDGTWQRVDLPHDWSIAFTPNEQAPAGGEGGCRGIETAHSSQTELLVGIGHVSQ